MLNIIRPRPDCGLGPREQFNEVSSTIDANTVYGSEEKLQSSLRTHSGGLLKTIPIFEEYNLHDMLPLKLEEPDDGCIRPCEFSWCIFFPELVTKTNQCFTSGGCLLFSGRGPASE